MPTVPTYDSPQVASRALPAVRESVNTQGSYGEGLASGLDRFNQGLGQVAAVQRQVKERADVVEATTGEASLSETGVGILHDKSNGYLLKKGKAAFEASTTALEQFEKKRQEISQSLKNEDQRRVFDARSRAMALRFRQTVESHAGQEMKAAEMDAVTARERAALGSISSDPTSLASEGTSVEVSMRALGFEESAVAQFKGRAAKAAIGTLLSRGNTDGAAQVLEQHRAYLGDDAGIIQKRVDEEKRALLAARETQRILTGSLNGEWVAPATAMEQVKTLPEGPFRDEVEERVSDAIKASDAMRKRRGGEMLNELISLRETGKGNDPRVRDIKAWMLDPKNDAADLWASYRKSVQAERNARGESGDDARRGQRERNLEALTEFQALHPDEQLDANPDTLYPDVDQVTRNRMRIIQRNLKVGSEKDARKATSVTEGDFYRELTKDVQASPGLKDKKKASKYISSMREQRAAFVEQHKRDPSIDELAKMKATVTEEVVVRGAFWNTKKPRFLLAPDDEVANPATEATPEATPRQTGSFDLAVPPSAQTSASAKPFAERAAELKRQGKTRDEAKVILEKEYPGADQRR